jgi:molybdenum cofactor cytidylyltransferase
MNLVVGVVILAAGRSRRMGQPKLLLPWGDTSVLGHLLRCWEQLQLRQIAVVVASDAQVIEPELDRLGFLQSNRIYNPAPDRGMFSSIQCAAAWSGWRNELTHWIITLGDQPHLQPATLRTLLDFGAANPAMICQPIRNGRRKHPVLLPKREFMALKNSSTTDLKQFLAEHADARAGFESEDAGLDLDIDLPEDYERARRL